MYHVVYKSSGIVAFKTGSKGVALAWLSINNVDEATGELLDLYKLIKA